MPYTAIRCSECDHKWLSAGEGQPDSPRCSQCREQSRQNLETVTLLTKDEADERAEEAAQEAHRAGVSEGREAGYQRARERHVEQMREAVKDAKKQARQAERERLRKGEELRADYKSRQRTQFLLNVVREQAERIEVERRRADEAVAEAEGRVAEAEDRDDYRRGRVDGRAALYEELRGSGMVDISRCSEESGKDGGLFAVATSKVNTEAV